VSLNADLPPEPKAPKEEAPKAKEEPKAEEMEEEDPESDLELDMTGVIRKYLPY
jgi:hypothetical protein